MCSEKEHECQISKINSEKHRLSRKLITLIKYRQIENRSKSSETYPAVNIINEMLSKTSKQHGQSKFRFSVNNTPYKRSRDLKNSY